MKSKTPDSLTIQQYLEGKLDPEMSHQLEKQALDDPFLWDALDGYSVYKDPAADLSILQRQLHERIVHMQENKKVFDLSWQRLSVAAAAAVMFVSAGILFWMNSHKAPEQLASESHRPVEVNVIDRDSVEAVIQSKDQPVIASLEKKESEADRQTVSTSNRGKDFQKEIVISSKTEDDLAARSAATMGKTQARTMSAKQAKSAEIAASDIEQLVVSGASTPKSGWPAYNQYLKVNATEFKAEPRLTGSVLISFQVASDGKLQNLKVIKGLNDTYDKEALRIVRNGSEWTPSSDGKVYDARVEVHFQQ